MPLASSNSAAPLQRRIGLRSAVAFNMLEMIGVGPFITLPLVIAAAGYRLSMWAWVLGAVIAVADGLVWAELGAAFPRAGGSYAFLREIYGPERAGNWLSFLYVWQVSFTAPLAIASGCIGLASFLAWFWPGLDQAPFAALPALHGSNFAAAAACLLVTALLYRNLSSITRLAWVLFAGVLAAIAGVIVSGFAHAAATGGWQMPASPAVPLSLTLGGLAQATLLTTYCYWGYYNICFLGGEVKRPERTIPRAILLSVLFVSAFYVLMNLAALPSMRDVASHASAGASVRLQLVADIARSAFGSVAGRLMAALIIWTAFASVFSLLAGYSRIPFAAARDGNFFSIFQRVHPRDHFPTTSVLLLGGLACLCCLFQLRDLVSALVVIRILLLFLLQAVGAVVWRITNPAQPRPFRMWLYPLPVLITLAGFALVLLDKLPLVGRALLFTGLGVVAFLLLSLRKREWPFATAAAAADKVR
jgi:amino acid transporter